MRIKRLRSLEVALDWTPAQLPDLDGRTYVITGGNGGLGLATAALLANKGGRIVISARDSGKARVALDTLRKAAPGAEFDAVQLDLSEPASVAEAIPAIRSKCKRIDALINNAGVMQTPEIRTSEGFELQMATNYFGHFRLNSGLYPLLEGSAGRIGLTPEAERARRKLG